MSTEPTEPTVLQRLRKARGEEIRAARDDLGWSQADLAEKAGTSQQTVDRIERGVTGHSRAYGPIRKALGLADLNDIDAGPAPSHDEKHVPVAPGEDAATEGYRRFTQDGRAIAKMNQGDNIVVLSSTLGSIRMVDAIPRTYPVLFVEDAYGLLVSDEDMVPAVRPGDIVIINPNLPPVVGTEVMISYRSADDKVSYKIRTLLRDLGEEWEVRTWSPPSIETLPKNEYPEMKVIVSKLPRVR